MNPGQQVRTPDGIGTISDITMTAVEPWATVEVDGIENEYLVCDLEAIR